MSSGLLAGWLDDLSRVDEDVPDAERIDRIRRLEELKSAAAAAQARITVAFDRSQRAEQEAAGVAARKLGSGVAAQVALARRDSPAKGGQHLGLARALVHEMPQTLAALQRGEISEWRATLLVRETACLSRADRSTVDAELGTRPGGWETAPRARRPAGSPTGWTRVRSPTGPARRSPTDGSPRGRHRTPWRWSPRCCRRSRESPSSPR